MNFEPSELQSAISDTLYKFLQDKYEFQTRVRRTNAKAWVDDLWCELAELGVLSVSMDEEVGGLGGGFEELAAVMRIFGRWIVNEPFLSSIIIGSGILKRSPAPVAGVVLAKITRGEVRVSLAHAETAQISDLLDFRAEATSDGAAYVLNGRKVLVLDAPLAEYFIVSAHLCDNDGAEGQDALFLVSRSATGITQTDYRTIDGGHMSDIVFTNVSLTADTLLISGNAVGDTLLRVQDEAILAICAEACGVMAAMLEMTVDYTRQRHQFGRAIADNQVIQHRLVDMMIGVKQATSMTNVACRMLESPDRQSIVAATKAFISKASRSVGQSAVQLHGGIGITNDVAVSHYFRRALMIEQQFGSSEEQLERYLELSQQMRSA
tara:strand:+ start:30566 stop:31702 length:1137 start_codon:yes stop_codon:yes gene_type:complete